MVHASLGPEFADMNQTVDPGTELDEGAEGLQPTYSAHHALTDGEAGRGILPGIAGKRTDRQRDLLPAFRTARRVDPQDRNLDRLADAEDFARMLDVTEGELADVDHAFEAADVDEGPVVL